MHDERDFTHPVARRYAGLALIRDEGGEVLLVEKSYRQGRDRFGLVGGAAGPGEPAALACQREVREETGLRLVPGAVVAVHYMPANGLVREGTNLVFDCGVIARDTPLTLPDSGELVGFRWAAPDELAELTAPYTAWRTHAALKALAGRGIPYLVGHPTFDVTALAAA